MRCVQPIVIHGREYPCGRCPACMRNKQNSWVFRLNEEMRISPYVYFFTLTYRDEDLSYLGYIPFKCDIPVLNKRDIQLFLKRLRKNTKVKFKYHIVGEYGPQTLRPHYHGLIFTQCEIDINDLIKAWKHSDLQERVFEPCYDRNAIGYVTKYVCAVPFLPGFLREFDKSVLPFTMCSNGLGLTYLESNPQLVNKKIEQLEDFVVLDGKKVSMPRYYRDKLFPIERSCLSIPVRGSNHEKVSLKKMELIQSMEDKRFRNFLFTHHLEDNDSSRVQYEEFKLMLRKDLWRKAYKNSKYNLSKMKI